MEGFLPELFKESPWVALVVFLLWRAAKKEDAALQAFKDGTADAKVLTEALMAVNTGLGQLRENVRDVHEAVRGMARQ